MSVPMPAVDAERAVQVADDAKHSSKLVHEQITGQILAAFFQVYRELGYGFLESVYARAIAFELLQRGLQVEQEVSLSVFYKGRKVGLFKADALVDGKVVIEVRAGPQLADGDRSQLLNYMRCSQADVGMLLHFGPRAEFRRFLGGGVFNRTSSRPD